MTSGESLQKPNPEESSQDFTHAQQALWQAIEQGDIGRFEQIGEQVNAAADAIEEPNLAHFNEILQAEVQSISTRPVDDSSEQELRASK
jgi:hypothetical protein